MFKSSLGKSIKICPNCMKQIVYEQDRIAELSPRDVIGYNKTRVKKVIGKLFYHKDETICDQTIYTIKKLKKPVYLRLGDPTRDPRV